MNKLKQMVKN